MGEIELNSLIQDAESNDDVSPQDLSGDESSEKSLVATVVDGQKSSTYFVTKIFYSLSQLS